MSNGDATAHPQKAETTKSLLFSCLFGLCRNGSNPAPPVNFRPGDNFCQARLPVLSAQVRYSLDDVKESLAGSGELQGAGTEIQVARNVSCAS
jgi:hypothetical protein